VAVCEGMAHIPFYIIAAEFGKADNAYLAAQCSHTRRRLVFEASKTR